MSFDRLIVCLDCKMDFRNDEEASYHITKYHKKIEKVPRMFLVDIFADINQSQSQSEH
jgi:hypothetical protein